VFLAVLLLQADPSIDAVELLAGEARRPLLWTPLKVTLSSKAGFRGDLVARSRFGFSVAKAVEVPANGAVRVIFPVLDAESVEAGPSRTPVPRARAAPDVVVAVDARLPFAGELTSTDRVLYAKLGLEDLRALLSSGLLEAADLVLLAESAGLDLGGPCAGVVVKTREEAERTAAAAGTAARLEARDPAAWRLRPEGGWAPAKRSRAGLLAGLYGFAGFAALTLAARRGARALGIALGALVAGGLAAVAVLLPRGQLGVEEHAVEIQRRDGTATEWRLWFATSAQRGPTKLSLPRLAKPVFPEFEGTDRPFTLRVEATGCAVEGLDLGPGRAAAFAAPGSRAASPPATRLRDAWARRGGRLRRLGDVELGAAAPAEIGTPEAEPKDGAYAAWKRFLEGDVVFGRTGGGEPAEEVGSPDLADARRGERFVIRRLE
jgi:hypothetical protein